MLKQNRGPDSESEPSEQLQQECKADKAKTGGKKPNEPQVYKYFHLTES